jgi:Spy/CpxP family protein refolding chaperone
MKKLRCFLFLMTIITLVATTAPAQQSQGYGMGDRVFPLLSHLLTAAQRQSLQQIMESQRGQIRPLEEKIRASRQALLDQITAGKFNESLVNQYAAQSAKAEADLTVIFARALSQMKPPFSAQQVAQLKSFQPDRRQAFRGDKEPAAAAAPEVHMKLPPPLPSDTNGLPVMN